MLHITPLSRASKKGTCTSTLSTKRLIPLHKSAQQKAHKTFCNKHAGLLLCTEMKFLMPETEQEVVSPCRSSLVLCHLLMDKQRTVDLHGTGNHVPCKCHEAVAKASVRDKLWEIETDKKQIERN